MGDFDWVSMRALYSSLTVFEKLKLQVQKDVEARNKYLAERRDAFHVKLDNNRFSIFVPTNPLRPGVVFSVADETIFVKDGKGELMFKATLTLNDEGECRVKINGQEREFWQMRKMALEELFFGPSDSSTVTPRPS